MGQAAGSLGLFALVWAAFCVVATAVVTETLLREPPPRAGRD